MRVRSITDDLMGLEGLPLKLLIVVLLTSLSMPLFIGTLDSYTEKLSIREIEAEIDKVEETALSAFLGGPGSVRIVIVTLNDRTGENVIVIGGPRGSPESHAVRIHTAGVVKWRYLDTVPTEISTGDDGSISLTSPGANLRLECISHGDEMWLMAEVIS